MKAVTAALVLIAGAAVVLWYGNTLNSWVLGGLIGGLAALLLSIPISLTVFSYLSKRHDERTQIEAQEEPVQEEDYRYLPARTARRPREVESYVLADEAYDAEWQEEERYEPRALPAPSPQRQGNRNSQRLIAQPQGQPLLTQRTQQVRPRGKETTVLHSTKKIVAPASFEPTSSLSQHRSEALRTARLEAIQRQQDQDIETTNAPKRGTGARPSQNLGKQSEQHSPYSPPQRSHRPSRQLAPQPPQVRPRRNVEPLSPQQESYREASAERAGAEPTRKADPHTDYLANPHMGRRSLQHREHPEGNSTTGNVNQPLVRRAPYMYDDDPLRHELAQQLDTPAVRRSSRFDEDEYDE